MITQEGIVAALSRPTFGPGVRTKLPDLVEEAMDLAYRQWSKRMAELLKNPATRVIARRVPQMLDCYEIAPQGFFHAEYDEGLDDADRFRAVWRLPERIKLAWNVDVAATERVDGWDWPSPPKHLGVNATADLEIPEEYETMTGEGNGQNITIDRILSLEAVGDPVVSDVDGKRWLIQSYRVYGRLSRHRY
jgi:hypothetical protein